MKIGLYWRCSKRATNRTLCGPSYGNRECEFFNEIPYIENRSQMFDILHLNVYSGTSVSTARASDIGIINEDANRGYRTQCGWNGTIQRWITIQIQVGELR